MRYAKVGTVTAVALTAIVALASCGRGEDGRTGATGDWAQEQASGEASALAVEALEVSRGSVLQTIEASGIIRGVNEANVVSEVHGIIQSEEFELGQYVREGDVLVRVESTIAALNFEEARQAWESAQLDLTAAERRFENGGASQSEVTRARSAANGAEARYQAARETLEDHAITAPISGFIAAKSSDIGRGNYLSGGVTVARVVDLSSLEMEIAVGEREIRYVTQGLDAQIAIPACGLSDIDGRVRSVAAGADMSTGSFPIIVTWENECDVARSGMTASVRIRPLEEDTRIIIPSTAIRRDASGMHVFVAVDNTIERRDIETGERLGDRVQVVDGLREGEIIVVSALSALSDGQLVEPTVRGRTVDAL